MSERECIVQASHRDDVDGVNSLHNPIQLGGNGAIYLPLAKKDVIIDVTSTNLYIL